MVSLVRVVVGEVGAVEDVACIEVPVGSTGRTGLVLEQQSGLCWWHRKTSQTLFCSGGAVVADVR